MVLQLAVLLCIRFNKFTSYNFDSIIYVIKS